MPDVVLSTSHTLTHLILKYPYEEDSDAQTGPVAPKRWNQSPTLAVGSRVCSPDPAPSCLAAVQHLPPSSCSVHFNGLQKGAF